MIDNTMPSDSAETVPLVLFDVGSQTCALSGDVIVEIVPMATMLRPPVAPSILEGFLNLGGTAIAVFRLSRLLEIADVDIELYAPVILVRQMDTCVGLLASAVRQMVTAPGNSIITLPDHGLAEQGLRHEDKIIPILSLERLLLEQERQRIAQLQAIQQQRLREVEEAQA